MKLPTPRQIARAWRSVTTDYTYRKNKMRKDGKLWEVVAIPNDGDVKVIQVFSDPEDADYAAERYADDACAEAVLALFRNRGAAGEE
jgi:hypothetical protein